jgi:rhodanese-related sulfurtransferase
MNPIDADTLHTWQSEHREFVLIDTLPESAYTKGHLPKAINIVSDNMLTVAPSLLPDKRQVIVVYCASEHCKRAGLSAERLESLGYQQIYHFVGGKRAWVEAGFSLEPQSEEAC